MNNWQKLCEAIRSHTAKPTNCPFKAEKCFEDHFVEYMRYIFGWEYNEVKRQRPTTKGKRTDIILHEKERKTIVIELKAFGKPISGKEIEQLQEYMEQLGLSFGIITNSVTLQLYYRTYNKFHTILKLHFDKDDPNGHKLGRLLTRNGYAEEKLKAYCKKQLRQKKDNKVRESSYDSKNRIMAEQMSEKLDDRILKMIPIYQKWLNDNVQERDYLKNYREGFDWVKKNVFTIPEQKRFTNQEYNQIIHEIPEHLTNIKSGASRTLYKSIDSSRSTFRNAIVLINSTHKPGRYDVLQKLLTDPKYSIKGMSKSFWSEIIRCKFDDVPLVNSKTEDFFIALGLNIGVEAADQVKNVSYCYSRWRELYEKAGGEIELLELSHMEHFAKTSKEGIKYMKENFGTLVGEYTA